MSTSHSFSETPVLDVRDVVKRYGRSTVLDQVNFRALPGRVHALLGANGAGKSTLVKIIAGLETADEGSITYLGQPVSALTATKAQQMGIALIPQERHICPDLTVGENISLSNLPTRAGLLQTRRLRAQARNMLAGLGFHHIDVDATAGRLSISDWQIIEIARALMNNSRLIILDEPTTALSASEADTLRDVIDRLRRRGVAAVYISHVLDEVFAIADDVAVLRDGRVVHDGPLAELDRRRITAHMLGAHRDADPTLSTRPAAGQRPVLVAANLSDGSSVAGLELRVDAGEIVCVVGGDGSGRQPLAQLLSGLAQPRSGRIRVNEVDVVDVRSALAARVAHVPDDRAHRGLFPELSVNANLAVGRLVAAGKTTTSPRRDQIVCAATIKALQIKGARPDVEVRRLSGGNQQKVLLGRWFDLGAALYVLEDPTVGVDIAARWDIYRLLRSFAAAGAAVLVFTSDHEEVCQLAHRAVVMHAGRIVGELVAGDIVPARLLALEMGA